jgi:hypothetical protein
MGNPVISTAGGVDAPPEWRDLQLADSLTPPTSALAAFAFLSVIPGGNLLLLLPLCHLDRRPVFCRRSGESCSWLAHMAEHETADLTVDPSAD